MVSSFRFLPRPGTERRKATSPVRRKKEQFAAVGKVSDSFAGTSLPAAHSPANGHAQVEKPSEESARISAHVVANVQGLQHNVGSFEDQLTIRQVADWVCDRTHMPDGASCREPGKTFPFSVFLPATEQGWEASAIGSDWLIDEAYQLSPNGRVRLLITMPRAPNIHGYSRHRTCTWWTNSAAHHTTTSMVG